MEFKTGEDVKEETWNLLYSKSYCYNIVRVIVTVTLSLKNKIKQNK
jgi:hypothetical protein